MHEAESSDDEDEKVIRNPGVKAVRTALESTNVVQMTTDGLMKEDDNLELLPEVDSIVTFSLSIYCKLNALSHSANNQG